MKKKEQKRFESTAFILLEVLAKAVEMKKLQLDEKKMNIDREMWLEKRSGQKVGSEVPKQKFPSGGITSAENWTGKIVGTGLLSDEKEFVIPKSLFPIQGGEKLTVVNDKPVSRNSNYKSLIQEIEEGGSIVPIKSEFIEDFMKKNCGSSCPEMNINDNPLTKEQLRSFPSIVERIKAGIENGTINEITWVGMDFGKGHSRGFDFKTDILGMTPKEIHEDAVKKGFESEKKCETASVLFGSYQEKKWYKNEDGKTFQYNKKDGTGYGVNHFGTWVDSAKWLKNKDCGKWVLATDEEVRKMLIVVSERLGFVRGIEFISATSIEEIFTAKLKKPDFYYIDDYCEIDHKFNMSMCYEGGVIFFDGKWAKIVK